MKPPKKWVLHRLAVTSYNMFDCLCQKYPQPLLQCLSVPVFSVNVAPVQFGISASGQIAGTTVEADLSFSRIETLTSGELARTSVVADAQGIREDSICVSSSQALLQTQQSTELSLSLQSSLCEEALWGRHVVIDTSAPSVGIRTS